MPELPEMETYRVQLNERIAGRSVTEVIIGREKSINVPAETFRMNHIGCHISIRNGYAGAARTAAAIGAKAFQYFPKNPRGLSVKEWDRTDALKCAGVCREFGIISIAHTAYATNLAAAASIREATIRSLRNDLDIAEACGSLGVVVHFGKWHRGGDPLEGYKLILASINDVLSDWDGGALLLIENQAGEGGGAGMTFEELASIRKLAEKPEKIGFCLDTCHLFASGVWDGRNTEAMLEQARALGFLTQLKAMHLNDSMYACGSRRDRHAGIGSGEIGLAAITELLRSLDLQGVPVVLETPVPAGSSHREEIALVQSLAR